MVKKKRVMNFKSKASYLRWVKFGQSTGVFASTPGNTKVLIKGKPYSPKHAKR